MPLSKKKTFASITGKFNKIKEELTRKPPQEENKIDLVEYIVNTLKFCNKQQMQNSFLNIIKNTDDDLSVNTKNLDDKQLITFIVKQLLESNIKSLELDSDHVRSNQNLEESEKHPYDILQAILYEYLQQTKTLKELIIYVPIFLVDKDDGEIMYQALYAKQFVENLGKHSIGELKIYESPGKGILMDKMTDENLEHIRGAITLFDANNTIYHNIISTTHRDSVTSNQGWKKGIA